MSLVVETPSIVTLYVDLSKAFSWYKKLTTLIRTTHGMNILKIVINPYKGV